MNKQFSNVVNKGTSLDYMNDENGSKSRLPTRRSEKLITSHLETSLYTGGNRIIQQPETGNAYNVD